MDMLKHLGGLRFHFGVLIRLRGQAGFPDYLVQRRASFVEEAAHQGNRFRQGLQQFLGGFDGVGGAGAGPRAGGRARSTFASRCCVEWVGAGGLFALQNVAHLLLKGLADQPHHIGEIGLIA